VFVNATEKADVFGTIQETTESTSSIHIAAVVGADLGAAIIIFVIVAQTRRIRYLFQSFAKSILAFIYRFQNMS